jgi:hypothetical protein
MVIRFRLRRKTEELRLETHPSGLNRTDARRLSAREIVHRERMLRHLEQLERAGRFNSPSRAQSL